MEFDTKDRLIILRVLPRQGSLSTLRIISELTSSLGFTEEEHLRLKLGPPCADCGASFSIHADSDHEFVPNTNRIVWDQDADFSISVSVGSVALDCMIGGFKALDDSEMLTMEMLEVYERLLAERESRKPKSEPHLEVVRKDD